MFMSALYVLSVVLSQITMANTLDEVDKKLENDNLKNPNKDNGYKYVLPILPSIIPGVNVVSALVVAFNEDKIYKGMKDIRCRYIVHDTKLEDTYNMLRGNKIEEMQKDLGDLNYLMTDNKDQVVDTLQDKYTGIVFYEQEKDKNGKVQLEEYIDDSLDEKKLVR